MTLFVWLNAIVADDVAMVANKVLRKNDSRLSPTQWASLMKDGAEIGERSLAVKLARQAREVCPGLKRLSALPNILVPWAESKSQAYATDAK